MQITRESSHIEHLKPQSTPDPDLSVETIKRLRLDISKLNNMREEVIKNLLADIDIDELTDEERQKLVQGFEQPDANGQYEEFCGAIAYILKQYFIA
jgi:hypothetical protein